MPGHCSLWLWRRCIWWVNVLDGRRTAFLGNSCISLFLSISLSSSTLRIEYLSKYHCFLWVPSGTLALHVQAHPTFSVCILSLCFYGRHRSVPVFANRKISEEDFRFYQKKAIGKNSTQRLFCSTVKLLPGATLSISTSSHRSFKLSVSICVFLNFFCASVNKMCPRVSENL